MKCLAFAAALAVAASNAAAQLVPSSPLVFTSRDESGLYDQDLSTAFEATDDTADGYNLNVEGHASLTFQPGQRLGAFDEILETILVARQFQVGPVPVAIRPELLGSGKIVISGDSNAAVSGRIDYRARVSESASVDLNTDPLEFSTFSDLGPTLYDGDVGVSRSGSGVTLLPAGPVNEGTVILAPGVNYTVAMNITVIDLDGRPLLLSDPVTKLTLEFGGPLSEFDGITLDLNARTVPEPAATGVLGGASLGLLLRRRRA